MSKNNQTSCNNTTFRPMAVDVLILAQQHLPPEALTSGILIITQMLLEKGVLIVDRNQFYLNPQYSNIQPANGISYE